MKGALLGVRVLHGCQDFDKEQKGLGKCKKKKRQIILILWISVLPPVPLSSEAAPAAHMYWPSDKITLHNQQQRFIEIPLSPTNAPQYSPWPRALCLFYRLSFCF